MTSSLNNSSKSSSFVNVSRQSSFVNVSRQSASTRTSYNFGVRSHSDTTSRSSDKKMPAENNLNQPDNTATTTRKNTKKISSKNKPPKNSDIESLGDAQKELINLMNVLFLGKIVKLYNNSIASDENIIACKEEISNQYTKQFHPEENNQRSFTNSLRAIKASIQEINKHLAQKNQVHSIDDFTMVSDHKTNSTPKEAMEKFSFQKDDFKSTRKNFDIK